jgi:hypothetical protein
MLGIIVHDVDISSGKRRQQDEQGKLQANKPIPYPRFSSRHARYDERMRLLFLLTSSLALAGEFSTAIGDAYPYTVQAMTTDAAGNTYLTGNRTLSSGVDVFVTKLDPTGAVVFTNNFGANAVGYVIAVDPSGNIYVGGSTASPDFLLTNAVQTQAPNAPTGFLVNSRATARS